MLRGVFFHGQYPTVGKLHVAVAAGAVGQRVRCAAVQGLLVQLLIGFVDEHHAVIAEAKRTPAIFIHPAAHAEGGGGQAMRLLIAPVPNAAGAFLRAVLVPEQAVGADPQFGKIDTGGNGEGGAERFSLLR